jgi:hypothetical protein
MLVFTILFEFEFFLNFKKIKFIIFSNLKLFRIKNVGIFIIVHLRKNRTEKSEKETI